MGSRYQSNSLLVILPYVWVGFCWISSWCSGEALSDLLNQVCWCKTYRLDLLWLVILWHGGDPSRLLSTFNSPTWTVGYLASNALKHVWGAGGNRRLKRMASTISYLLALAAPL